jgi:hypothetical protein
VTPAPKVISPSGLARFYFHECERFLRFDSVQRDDRRAEGVPQPPVDPRPVTQAILDSGLQWEEQVITGLLSGRVHIGPGEPGTALSARAIEPDDARRLLCSIRPGETIYQPKLDVPPRLYERFGHDPALIHWARCRPDLIEAVQGEDGGIELRVIDIKASPGVKLSHRIQATVYAFVLDALLEEWGADDRRVSETAGVWLAQHLEPEHFDLRALRPPIEQFLTHELPALLAAPAEQAPWHLYFRCEWCPWFEHCREQMRATDSVSRVPYLTTHAKRFLTGLEPPAATVGDFGQLLADPDRVRELDNCASLRGRGERLATQVDALETDEVRAYGGSSLAMPVLEHVRLVITAQTEPVSGQLYAFGLYAHGLKDVLGVRNRTIVEVADTGEPEAIAALERRLVRELWEIVGAVDAYNADHEEWLERKSLQAFCFDTYERELLTGALMRRLVDPEVAEHALLLLFHFQGPDLLQADEHPAGEVFFPLVVLTSILRDRLALPAEVSYRFQDAVRMLAPSSYAFDFTDNPYFAFALSNQLRSDAIYAVWYRGETERVDAIRKELRVRLWATNSAVSGTRERLDADRALFAYPPKLELPRAFEFDSPMLSRLAFLASYEAVLGYIDLRQRRMAPLHERVAAGDAVVLRHLEGDRFAVEQVGEDLELGEDTFPRYLLAADNDDGHQATLKYDDWFNRDRVWVPKRVRLRVAGIHHVADTPARELRLELTEGPDTPPLQAGGRYVLGRRFTDFGTTRVFEELVELDAAADTGFCQLVSDPHAYAAELPLPDAVRQRALELAAAHAMTPSQLEALRGTTGRRLQLVWGPPGTGKTHFLALALLCLTEAHRQAGLPLRVLISAFTHAAIENVLRKLDELQAELGVVAGPLALGKLAGIRGDAGEVIDEVGKKGGDGWLAERDHAILGGTVWALRRLEPETADIVVLDEASQLRVPESAIAVRRLARDGRVLVAGDDRQLPPIVQGAYPDPEPGEPLLHRSIFEALRAADPDERYTATLLENFRMNATLCRYPADQVYVPAYGPASAAVAQRRLALGGDSGDWTDLLLDPEHPLVVCVLDGVQATAENIVEAALVGDVVTDLRGRLLDAGGHPYGDDPGGDSAFWTDGLFIVCPHHAQIRAINRALHERRTWYDPPFVDTVDKMQGQERDAVIVSYGVSDVEYALNEKEFIYSLNRLNVAITRARAKTILFLPRPLLEPPVAAFDDDRIAEGIGFMQGLWRFAERHGDRAERALDDGAVLHVHRVSATVRNAVAIPTGALT